jgi:hypothetical protein
MSSLDSSKIQFEVFKSGTIDIVLDAIFGSSKASHIVFLGIESAALNFRIIVQGTTNGAIMNEVQKQYFEETTKYFLDFYAGNCAVFGLEVNSQALAKIDSRRQRNLIDQVAVEITGRLLGAHPAALSANYFKNVIERAFENDKETYIALLKGNVIRPGKIYNDSDFTFFLGIVNAKGTVKLEEASSRRSKSFVGATVIGVVMGTFIVVVAYLVFKHFKRERQRNKELAFCREQRRKERHARRLEQFTRASSVESFDADSVNLASNENKRHGPESNDKFFCSIPYPAVKEPLDDSMVISKERAKPCDSSSFSKDTISHHCQLFQSCNAGSIDSHLKKQSTPIVRDTSSQSFASLPNIKELQNRTVARNQASCDFKSICKLRHHLGHVSDLKGQGNGGHLARNKSSCSSTSLQSAPIILANSDVHGDSGHFSVLPDVSTPAGNLFDFKGQENFVRLARNKSNRSSTSLQHAPSRIQGTSRRSLLSSEIAARNARSLCDIKIHDRGTQVLREKSNRSSTLLQDTRNSLSISERTVSIQDQHLDLARDKSSRSSTFSEEK